MIFCFKKIVRFSQQILSILIIFIFTTCETTKVIYHAKSSLELKRVGVVKLNKDITQIENILPKLDSSFVASAIKYGNRFLATETKYFNEIISYKTPQTEKIKQLCMQNNLDGIIVNHINFRFVTNQIYFITTDSYMECILCTKLFDKNGNLLFDIVHDSKNDSYDKIPNVYDVINLSIGITNKKIYELKK
jgi:hypothetical protein